MNAPETQALIGALVGLFTALQVWLTYHSVEHAHQLNGLMAPAIATGAAAVVIAAQQASQITPTLVSPPIVVDTAAQVIALRKELARLTSRRL